LSNPSWVDSTVHGDTPGMTDTNYLINPRQAAFARYLRDVNVYKCPAEKTIFKRPGSRPLPKLRSYSMNDYITPPGGGSWGNQYHYKLTSQILRPTGVFIFIDVEPGSMCYTPFRIPENDFELWFTAPGAMHGRGASLTFADGHAEFKKWRRANFRPPQNNSPHPSPSDRIDVMWLRRRAHHLLQ
jgi:prepilin-type processing-associated H-X9-DG protein